MAKKWREKTANIRREKTATGRSISSFLQLEWTNTPSKGGILKTNSDLEEILTHALEAMKEEGTKFEFRTRRYFSGEYIRNLRAGSISAKEELCYSFCFGCSRRKDHILGWGWMYLPRRSSSCLLRWRITRLNPNIYVMLSQGLGKKLLQERRQCLKRGTLLLWCGNSLEMEKQYAVFR